MVQAALPEPKVPIPRLAERFRVAAEAMENAGCYELAFTTVVAICRLTAHGDAVTATLATLHLGRIARQMNDFPSAQDCYDRVVSRATRKRDAPLAARGHIGQATCAAIFPPPTPVTAKQWRSPFRAAARTRWRAKG